MSTTGKDDTRLLELLNSRLCHDLVGTVSAINNGLELLSEFGDQMDGEAGDLVMRSAAAAAHALQFYRLAFGFAGGDDAMQPIHALQELTRNFLAREKIEANWDGNVVAEAALPNRQAKLLLNTVLLAIEALPRGGEIAIALEGGDSPTAMRVAANGQDAGLRPEIRSALSADARVDELTPRSAQAYYTVRLSSQIDADLSINSEQDRVEFAAKLG